jgi:hypothetical protein
MRKNKILIIAGVIIILSILFYKQYSKQIDIKNNRELTEGEIIKLEGAYKARYRLVYSYFVDGVNYTGKVRVTPFKCDNGKDYCIGKEFPVHYSSKNPQNSRIDLGKYEKYKTTVEFFN